MEAKGLMGGLYRISEWIMRLSVINLLWIICSLPVVLLFFFEGYILFQVTQQQIDQFGPMYFLARPLLYASILVPLTLFPATAAMFTVARKWVMGETDVALFKTFFRGYKENFKQSVIGGFVYTLLFIIIIVDFIWFKEQLPIIAYLFIALFILLVVSLFNYFSMMVHYHMKMFQLIKNALLITLGKPFRSFSTAIMCGFVVYVSFFHIPFLVLFFMGSIVAAVAFWNFNLIYMKLQQQAEKMKASEVEAVEEAAEMNREDLVKGDSNKPNN
ncbi:DUF624 domain-containing protein [Paenibacillus sp. GSMTC-2017]|uniref:YesL family protein n=1 Tax=Paenibacillus sp. GSMTC-2017 TaxID=2794350 RepID=UPI0018D9F7C7|nr:DUF624 domain-containing protein [Paenibacillus sp. GSMTC-2017]MBH5318204.1 DUF624 domain-containing protein [Paenibacillus sp. GSMTC-2017]